VGAFVGLCANVGHAWYFPEHAELTTTLRA
jgi:hypothetical protein